MRPYISNNIRLFRVTDVGRCQFMLPNSDFAVANSTVEEIYVAKKIIHKRISGIFINLVRSAFLLNSTFVHHRNAVGDFQRLILIVGNKYARYRQFVVEPPQPPSKFSAHLCIQSAERLIQQKNFRFNSQCPNKRYALPLPSGKLGRIQVGHALKLDKLEQFNYLASNLLFIWSDAAGAYSQPKGDVFKYVHVSEE